MGLLRWDPFSEMTSLRQAMDRLFEESVVAPRLSQLGGRRGEGGFELDVLENDDALVVKASLPGVKPEDVDITVHQNVLTIRGVMREELEEGSPGGRYHWRERRVGSVARQIPLPSGVNPEACEASFEHGVLTITLPKAEEAKQKKISVRGGQGRAAIEGQQVQPGQPAASSPPAQNTQPAEAGPQVQSTQDAPQAEQKRSRTRRSSQTTGT